MSNLALIVGCCRCGGTWLAKGILKKHCHINLHNELQPQWQLSKLAAYDPTSIDKITSELLGIYYHHRVDSEPKPWFIDKSHFNIWSYELLSAKIPDAKFIGLCRMPLGNVSSMLEKKSTRAQLKKLNKKVDEGRQILPAYWLGVTKEYLGVDGVDLVKLYESFSMQKRGFLRWMATLDQMMKLKRDLPDRTLLVQYEDLILWFDETIKKICNFLGIEKRLDRVREPNRGCLNKWHGLGIEGIKTARDLFEDHGNELALSLLDAELSGLYGERSSIG